MPELGDPARDIVRIVLALGVRIRDRPPIIRPRIVRIVVAVPLTGPGQVDRRIFHHRAVHTISSCELGVVQSIQWSARRGPEVVSQTERVADFVHYEPNRVLPKKLVR